MGETRTKILVLFTFFLFTLHSTTAASDFILKCCSATLYPDLCYSSLSPYASAVQQDPITLAVIAASTVTIPKINSAHSLAETLKRNTTGLLAGALQDCVELLGSAASETKRAASATRKLRDPKRSGSIAEDISNAQTWLSGAMTDEETCVGGLDDVKEGSEKKAMKARLELVNKYSSNALALVNALVQ